MTNKLIILDRDGVINRSLVRDGKPYAPTQISEFKLLPGVPAALSRLREHGFLNIVVTNQPDIATGKQRREDIAQRVDEHEEEAEQRDLKHDFTFEGILSNLVLH